MPTYCIVYTVTSETETDCGDGYYDYKYYGAPDSVRVCGPFSKLITAITTLLEEFARPWVDQGHLAASDKEWIENFVTLWDEARESEYEENSFPVTCEIGSEKHEVWISLIETVE